MPDDVSEPKHTAMNKLKKTGVVRDCFNTYSHDVFNTSRDVSSWNYTAFVLASHYQVQ